LDWQGGEASWCFDSRGQAARGIEIAGSRKGIALIERQYPRARQFRQALHPGEDLKPKIYQRNGGWWVVLFVEHGQHFMGVLESWKEAIAWCSSVVYRVPMLYQREK
jgi:hypothetical protein